MPLSRLPLCGLFLAVALPVGALASPCSAAGQAILNTERFQLEEVDGFHFGADLSVSGQRGNTDLLDVGTSGIVGRLSERHWVRAIFGGRYLSDEDRSILDRRYAQLRYSYILRRGLRTFHFVQAQKNESLRLRSRWLLGTGIRRDLVRGDRLGLAAGTGVMGERERFDDAATEPGDPTRDTSLRMANLAVASWELAGGARILNILYLQPELRDFSDLRILNDLALAVPVTDHVRTTLTLEWRRDTRPPTGLERDDVTIGMGVGIEFR